MRRILIFLLLLTAPLATAQETYDKWFEQQALRVDLYHSGTDELSSYSLDEVIIEGPWPGNRINLLDTTGLGNSRFTIIDKESEEPLYSRGFSTMFREWQTTDEAKERARTMQETIRFPKPKADFILIIEERNTKMEFEEVYRVEIDPNFRNVRREIKHKHLKTFDLHIGNTPDKALDILILADGYTAAEQDKLLADATRLGKAFIEHAPFSEHADKINIRTIGIISNESGIDQPRQEIFVDSALDCSYNSFDSARYVLTPATKTMRDYAALVPYDTIAIMFNTERYGGGGIFNLFCTFAADDDRAVYLFLHEGGHSIFGLGDEYYNSQVSYNEFHKKDVEPWEPNITALLDPANVKWKHLIPEGTPIPTPADEEYEGVAGVFEGAGYEAKGLYRPTIDSIMKSNTNLDFGPVNTAHIIRLLEFYTDSGSW